MSNHPLTRVRIAGVVTAGLLSIVPSIAIGQTSGQTSAVQPPVAATLTFAEAIERGLQFNLRVIESDLSAADARATRRRALSALLPTVGGRAVQAYEDLSLKEIGLTIPGLPATTGGFGFQDFRANLSQSLYSSELRNRYRSEQQTERAAGFNARDEQDVIVLSIGAAYLQIVARAAQLETANAELRSAQEFDRQATDRVTAEVAPEIESLRAQVERQTAEQRVVNARNDLEKDRLTLSRLLGLPIQQTFVIETGMDYRPLTGLTEESAGERALKSRADLAAAAAAIEASEFAVRSRRGEQQPTAAVTADYGSGGVLPHMNQVYAITASVTVPLYTGGRIKADVQLAENTLARRRAEYDDLKRRVAYDIRTAWLDITASESGIAVAQRNKDLADRAEVQALDRYANGVTNYLEVVQARETVARADDTLVASLYTFNVAKLTLARAIGDASNTAKEFFRHE